MVSPHDICDMQPSFSVDILLRFATRCKGLSTDPGKVEFQLIGFVWNEVNGQQGDTRCNQPDVLDSRSSVETEHGNQLPVLEKDGA